MRVTLISGRVTQIRCRQTGFAACRPKRKCRRRCTAIHLFDTVFLPATHGRIRHAARAFSVARDGDCRATGDGVAAALVRLGLGDGPARCSDGQGRLGGFPRFSSGWRVVGSCGHEDGRGVSRRQKATFMLCDRGWRRRTTQSVPRAVCHRHPGGLTTGPAMPRIRPGLTQIPGRPFGSPAVVPPLLRFRVAVLRDRAEQQFGPCGIESRPRGRAGQDAWI